jgi:hypothetical protein
MYNPLVVLISPSSRLFPPHLAAVCAKSNEQAQPHPSVLADWYMVLGQDFARSVPV